MSTPRSRTPAQNAASKRNAARSTGPATAVGKAIASTNGTTHGLASRGVLLSSETAEEYEANLDAWLETIHPGTPGEGHLVARVADVAWRLGRLNRLEERLVLAAVDRRVAESAPAKALRIAQEARQAVRGLAALAGEVRSPRAAEDVARLAPALRFVVELLGRTEVGVADQVAVERSVGALLEECYGDVEPAAFLALATAARGADEALTAEVGRLQGAVDVEREKLAGDVLFADEADAKVIDRHRGRLNREMGRSSRTSAACVSSPFRPGGARTSRRCRWSCGSSDEASGGEVGWGYWSEGRYGPTVAMTQRPSSGRLCVCSRGGCPPRPSPRSPSIPQPVHACGPRGRAPSPFRRDGATVGSARPEPVAGLDDRSRGRRGGHDAQVHRAERGGTGVRPARGRGVLLTWSRARRRGGEG